MEERCNRDARAHDLGLSLEPVVYDPAEHERLLAAELIKLCDKGDDPDVLVGVAMFTYGQTKGARNRCSKRERHTRAIGAWCRPWNCTPAPTPNRTCKFPSIRLSR